MAFSRIGMMMASDGASIKCTNDVLSNACKQRTVFLPGSARAPRIIGEISTKRAESVDQQSLVILTHKRSAKV